MLRDGLRRREKTVRTVAKKSSKTSELYAAAQMRLQDFLVASVGDDGLSLPAGMRENIATVINSDRKTYRYMLFVGLLVSVTDQSLHPRCLQQKATCDGAFNARSLCAAVVVPFEKSTLKGRLGVSGYEKHFRFKKGDIHHSV